MDISPHHLGGLFEQLGLPSDEAGVRAFIEQHSPLDPELALADAPFWNSGQRAFLREAIEADADWAELVDHLDSFLRR